MVQYLDYSYGISTSVQRKKVLSQFALYQYDSFFEVVKTFDEYPAFICALAKRMCKIYSRKFYLVRFYGVKKKILALKDEVIAKQKEEVQKKYKQRQQDAFNAKINSVIRLQHKELEACKVEYKNICEQAFINDDKRIRYISRIKEIDQFFAQKPEFFDKNYYIRNEVVEYVAQCGQSNLLTKKFSHCYGNNLQQAAHKECIDALSSYSQLYKTVRIQGIHDLMLHSAQAGCQLAQSGHITKAFSCADLCFAIVDFSQAVSEGVFDGVSNVVDIALHPIQTVQNTVYGLATVAYYARKTVHDLGAIGVNCCIDPQVGKEQWSEYCDGIEKTCNVIWHQVQELTVHGVVRGATAFAVETILMTRLLSSTHKVCRIAKSNIAEFVKLAEAGEVVAVTIEGVPIKIANPNVQRFDGAIKNIVRSPVKYIEIMHANIMQEVTREIAAFRKIFDNKIKGFAEFANKCIKIDYEHILGMELSFTKKMMPQIKGMNHDFMRKIERSKLFKFVDLVEHKNGCYKARIFYNGDIAKHKSTFFPSDWSREKVIGKIYEAYEYFLKNGEKVLPDKGGKYIINGLTKEGIKIEMCITKKGLIKSAYPVFK